MISARLLTLDEVRGYLSRYGCELIEDVASSDPYYGASYWRTAWNHHFYVPWIGTDRLYPDERFFDVLGEVARLAPRD